MRQSPKELKLYMHANMLRTRQGIRHLVKGEFEEGWKLYKYRNQIQWFDRRFKCPYWDGSDISGKTLLLMYEQGIGEQIFFASIIPELVMLGIKVILEVDERLVTLMQRSFPEIEVIPYIFPVDERCYAADYQVFLGTAFGYLRPNFEAHKAPVGYLKADTSIAKDIFPADIGLSWASHSQHYSSGKSIPLALFKPLIENGKKSVISVQYGKVSDTYISCPNFDITQNIENCAALLTRCSTIVTVSNAVAHLAGALGVETHVLVPNTIGRHFYWYPEKDFVPNYPSASAYLQMPAKDWGPCVEYITKKVVEKT